MENISKERFDAVLEIVLSAIEEAYGIGPFSFVTATANGSMLSDLPAYIGAPERLSEILGFPVRGNEFFYELVHLWIGKKGV
jgi:hypothetical protein